MAISVVSSTAAASAVTAAASAQTATALADSSSGFTDLLFSQLGNNIGGLLKQAVTDGKGMKASQEKDASLPQDTGALATDPALAFLMATPVAQVPLIPTTDVSFDPATQALPAAQALLQPAKDAGLEPILATRIGKQITDVAGKSPEANPGERLIDDTAKAPSIAALQNFLATQGVSPSTAKGSDSLNMPANIAAAAESPTPPPGTESALLVASNAAQALKAETSALAKMEIGTPLHSSTWTQDFGEKLVWLAKNDQQQAQISINPPQLGPIQITLQINGDQASAMFTSPHAEVRQAIENSLPQLKELLSNAGINLGQANVGANLTQQNRETPFQSTNGTRLASENAILPGIANAADSSISSPIQRGRGLVDLFA